MSSETFTTRGARLRCSRVARRATVDDYGSVKGWFPEKMTRDCSLNGHCRVWLMARELTFELFVLTL